MVDRRDIGTTDEEPPTSRTDGDVPGSSRSPGWLQVLAVSGAVVVFVFALVVLTDVAPGPLRDLVLRTPLAIVALAVVTVGLLLSLAGRSPDR